MGRPRAEIAAGLLVASLVWSGCGDASPPLEPTPTAAVPAQEVFTFSLSGWVGDSASRPLGGARVEIISAQRARTIATTDESGQFSVPGRFTAPTTLIASKDGYEPESRIIPPPGRPFLEPSGGTWQVAFSLAPLGPSVNMAGVFTMTLTADSSCTQLPPEARARTYTAAVAVGSRPTSLLVTLTDARFHGLMPCPPGRPTETCAYNRFGIGIAGEHANIGMGFIERLDETAYLVVSGGAQGTGGPTGITTPLEGQLLYCPSEPSLIDQGAWTCSDEISCDSRQHLLSLIRR